MLRSAVSTAVIAVFAVISAAVAVAVFIGVLGVTLVMLCLLTAQVVLIRIINPYRRSRMNKHNTRCRVIEVA